MRKRDSGGIAWKGLMLKIFATQVSMLILLDLVLPSYADKMLSLYSNIPFLEYSDLRSLLSAVTEPIKTALRGVSSGLI